MGKQFQVGQEIWAVISGSDPVEGKLKSITSTNNLFKVQVDQNVINVSASCIYWTELDAVIGCYEWNVQAAEKFRTQQFRLVNRALELLGHPGKCANLPSEGNNWLPPELAVELVNRHFEQKSPDKECPVAIKPLSGFENAVLNFVDARGSWFGSIRDFQCELEKSATESEKNTYGWPSGRYAWLSSIRRAMPALKEMGIHIQVTRESQSRAIEIYRVNGPLKGSL